MPHWTILGLCLILLAGLASAADVPFVFDRNAPVIANYTSSQIEKVHLSSQDLTGVPAITQAADNERMAFPVAGGGNISEGKVDRNVGELKRLLESRVETGNSRVRDKATVLAAKYPGDHTIGQISEIYDYLKNGDSSRRNWAYVPDPRGIDYFSYANETLRNGEEADCVGAGDCDDFAILMSALLESVGGATRIILAHNNSTGGHAYTEVYLGSLDSQKSQVEEVIGWLMQKYNADKIYANVDTETMNVWLNLDWGLDEKGYAHPGGPFFKGDKHIELCIRDKFPKTPVGLPEIEDSPKSTTADAGDDHPVGITKDPFFNDVENIENTRQSMVSNGIAETTESSMSSSRTSIRGGYWG
jgi:hypothetical protein